MRTGMPSHLILSWASSSRVSASQPKGAPFSQRKSINTVNAFQVSNASSTASRARQPSTGLGNALRKVERTRRSVRIPEHKRPYDRDITLRVCARGVLLDENRGHLRNGELTQEPCPYGFQRNCVLVDPGACGEDSMLARALPGRIGMRHRLRTQQLASCRVVWMRNSSLEEIVKSSHRRGRLISK